ncbi:MAG: response regulator transcription factor [Spirochaetes bacterium]|nr:response regulator transcription factor [Spirochaetota bacterium]
MKEFKEKIIWALDDEEDIIKLLKINLEKAGYIFEGFIHPENFLNKIFIKESSKPDLIILDLMLPQIDGFEIYKKIKEIPDLKNKPVIFLTAKNEEIDRVLGIELGADDYIVKPFSPRELIGRIKNILNKYDLIYKADEKDSQDSLKLTSAKKDEKNDIINYKNEIIINLNSFDVIVNQSKIKLTYAEFKILELLLTKPNWVFSRDQILEYLWGDQKYVIDRTIDVHITNLRKKLGSYGEKIQNIRGIGYKFNPD